MLWIFFVVLPFSGWLSSTFLTTWNGGGGLQSSGRAVRTASRIFCCTSSLLVNFMLSSRSCSAGALRSRWIVPTLAACDFLRFTPDGSFVLLLIGLTNWVLFDWDSTLVEYALAGYLLFLFRARSLKIVLAAALLCNCYWPGYEAVVIHKHMQQLTDPGTAEATREADIKAKAEEAARAEEN